MLFIMVNSMKNYSHKKNCLTCDHTTGEVLTTTNNDYNNIYFKHLELDLT